MTPTRRKGAGLPLFGKSFTYAAARPNMRIDFQFDNAAFHFRFLPFTLPYPVPFRLLGDETKVRPVGLVDGQMRLRVCLGVCHNSF